MTELPAQARKPFLIMTWKSIFLAVTGCALAGMVMGGSFGLAAGKITPDFFGHLIPWRDVEPVGFATFLGATVGVVLGGGLGCFGILIQGLLQWRKQASRPDALTPQVNVARE
jgi:hypothetical protein